MLFHHQRQRCCPVRFVHSFLILCDPLHAPVSLLRAPEDLFALVRQLGLAAVARDLLEKDGLELGPRALAVAGLFALCLLEVLLDGGGLGELLGVDGVRDAAPELERLVGQLLLHGREGLGGDAEGADVDDGGACFLGVRVLFGR